MMLCKCGNWVEGTTNKCASCNAKERKLLRKREPTRTPIRKVSKKRAKQLSKYSELKANFLSYYQICQVPGCGAPSQDVHHTKGRENELLLDVEHWLAICRKHHTYYTEHSNEAISIGVSKSRNRL